MTIVGTNPDAVIGGVDTHAEVHVAAVVNHVGGPAHHTGDDPHPGATSPIRPRRNQDHQPDAASVDPCHRPRPARGLRNRLQYCSQAPRRRRRQPRSLQTPPPTHLSPATGRGLARSNRLTPTGCATNGLSTPATLTEPDGDGVTSNERAPTTRGWLIPVVSTQRHPEHHRHPPAQSTRPNPHPTETS